MYNLAGSAEHRLPTLAYLRVDELLIDTNYQRPAAPKKILKIADKFDPIAAGGIIVSKRTNGQKVVLDGQHRTRAARIAGVPEILCIIHEGLSFEEEATIFAMCNTQRANPSATAVFRAKLAANQGHANAIREIVEECGYYLELNGNGAPRVTKDHVGIVAIGALQTIYDGDGGDRLREVLKVIAETWPDEAEAVRSQMIKGVWMFIRTYEDDWHRDHFVSRLAKSTPTAILRRAVAFASLAGGSTHTNVARAILEEYNVQLKGRRLDDRIMAKYESGKRLKNQDQEDAAVVDGGDDA